MKQKRTARGHLCVTHEVKAKHDLSSDVCKFSKNKNTHDMESQHFFKGGLILESYLFSLAQISPKRCKNYPEI